MEAPIKLCLILGLANVCFLCLVIYKLHHKITRNLINSITNLCLGLL